MKTAIVVAVADNGVIGHDGAMPWHLSTDLKRFRDLTMGKPMIMGRKTFESIGRALPGRTSIVVTRNRDWQAEGAVPVGSVENAMEVATRLAEASDVDEACVIGGGEIFRQTISRADVLYVTHVHAEPEGNAWFPEIDPRQWREISRQEIPKGEKDSAATSYVVYHRTA